MQVRGRIVGMDAPATITLEGDRISSISANGTPDDAIGGDDVWVSAGICDVQVNGVGGISYKAKDLTVEKVIETTEWMYKIGTAKWCPTVTTSSAEDATQGLRLLAKACEESENAGASFCGFHVEGPYIASEDGPRGAHPLEHTRDPDWDEFRRYQDAANGKIVIFTLAPERDGALAFIEKVVATGVIVSIGHTGATPDRIREAVSAGARMSTHLGNGAHALIPRHPNYIWEQLASDDLWAGVIPDSYHLPPAVLKSFYRAKRRDNICIVSDIASVAGLPPGVYGNTVGGGGVELAENGRLSLAGTPYLAGAALFLDTGIANMVAYTDANLADSIQMATANPARLLGLRSTAGTVNEGKEATLSLFRWKDGDSKLETVATIVAGRAVYQV